MVRSAFRLMLEEARSRGRGIGAFTCYDLVGLEAVIEAATARDAPVVVLVSPSSYAGAAGQRLARAFVAAAALAPTDVVVQLDHCADPRAIERSVSDGLGAALADGSHLPVAENLAFTCAARTVVGTMGLEAELGSVAGHEDRAQTTAAGEMTDPDEAGRFAAGSGADCLAVAVGNVHGHYAGRPQLDWDRLARIAHAVSVPLALHGASGLPDEDIRRAIGLGVAKVNVNTELRAAYLAAVQRSLADRTVGADLKGLGDDARTAVRAVVESKLELLGWDTIKEER